MRRQVRVSLKSERIMEAMLISQIGAGREAGEQIRELAMVGMKIEVAGELDELIKKGVERVVASTVSLGKILEIEGTILGKGADRTFKMTLDDSRLVDAFVLNRAGEGRKASKLIKKLATGGMLLKGEDAYRTDNSKNAQEFNDAKAQVLEPRLQVTASVNEIKGELKEEVVTKTATGGRRFLVSL